MTQRQFPTTRMRRLRKHDFSRRLAREHTISADDLIWPIFITQESGYQEIPSMPGVSRNGPEQLLKAAEQAMELEIPAIVLFPALGAEAKSEHAQEAWNPEGLVQSSIRRVKQRFPELGVITDVALDPYTEHGQDGLMNDQGDIVNDETIEALIKQGLSHAEAGADVLGPSDMMDGRVGAIRQALENAGHTNTMILSYAAKYSSAFYGPFRDAVKSGTNLGEANKHTYQMDPANSDEALDEIQMDVDEGADMVMVKPALAYLDIIRRARELVNVPVCAYQVSGEYAMVMAAAQQGWLNQDEIMMETLLGIKRAGAHAILTYFAPAAAKLLRAQAKR